MTVLNPDSTMKTHATAVTNVDRCCILNLPFRPPAQPLISRASRMKARSPHGTWRFSGHRPRWAEVAEETKDTAETTIKAWACNLLSVIRPYLRRRMRRDDCDQNSMSTLQNQKRRAGRTGATLFVAKFRERLAGSRGPDSVKKTKARVREYASLKHQWSPSPWPTSLPDPSNQG